MLRRELAIDTDSRTQETDRSWDTQITQTVVNSVSPKSWRLIATREKHEVKKREEGRA
jgi:hypothetical protein